MERSMPDLSPTPLRDRLRAAPLLAALGLIAACGPASPSVAALTEAPAAAPAIVVSGDAHELPMDSLRLADRLAPPDQDDAAAQLRDARLPTSTSSAAIALAHPVSTH